MPYDEGLAERIREILNDRSDVSERQMFGGLALLVRGHMCVGIVKDDLMVRVGPDAYDDLVREKHVRKMDFTGRPMRGFVYVASKGLEPDAALQLWVGRGVAYATSLPPKSMRGKTMSQNKRSQLPRSARPRGRGARG